MKISRFEDLECWKEARLLTRQVNEAIDQILAGKKNSGSAGKFKALRHQ
jgi:hypothetical protein